MENNGYYRLLFEADAEGYDREVVANVRIDELQKEILKHKKSYNSGVNMETAYFIHMRTMKAYDEIQYLEKHKKRIDPYAKISQADIDRARDFPIHELIEFKNGKAMAWCHADRSPSLSWWRDKNKAYCFPCSKAFDSIDVIMYQQEISFYEAVRVLL